MLCAIEGKDRLGVGVDTLHPSDISSSLWQHMCDTIALAMATLTLKRGMSQNLHSSAFFQLLGVDLILDAGNEQVRPVPLILEINSMPSMKHGVAGGVVESEKRLMLTDLWRLVGIGPVGVVDEKEDLCPQERKRKHIAWLAAEVARMLAETPLSFGAMLCSQNRLVNTIHTSFKRSLRCVTDADIHYLNTSAAEAARARLFEPLSVLSPSHTLSDKKRVSNLPWHRSEIFLARFQDAAGRESIGSGDSLTDAAMRALRIAVLIGPVTKNRRSQNGLPE